MIKKLLSVGLAISAITISFVNWGSICASAVTLDTNPLQSRTMFEVKNAYLASANTFDYSQSIYAIEPSNTAPYAAGQIQDAVINDTLNQLNYFRWQCGLNNVGINTSTMLQNQWGAVALSANNVLTHSPARPAGMDDTSYNLALAGAGAGYNYSGNCALGYSIQNSIKGYIDDVNVSGVGHRYSLLNRTAFATSFGSCGNYSTLSMFVNYDNGAYSDPYYSWPSAGYIPVEAISPYADWSISLSRLYSCNANTKVTLTADNGASYTVDSSGLIVSSYYNSISYAIPAGLRDYLSDNTNMFLGGKSVKVAVSGLQDTSGQEVNFSYNTKFFTANPIIPTNITVWRNMGSYYQSVNGGVSLKTGESANMMIMITPNNSTDQRLNVTSANPVIAQWDETTSSIIGLSGGTTTLTFTSVANPQISASCTVIVSGPSASVTSISSNYYKINTDNNTITGISPNTTCERFLSYINERANLSIYRNGVQISGSQFVGTGTQIQLTYNGNILQSLYAVVRGDLDGDGKISTADLKNLNNSMLSNNFTNLTSIASDVDGDGKISVFDSLIVKKEALSN